MPDTDLFRSIELFFYTKNDKLLNLSGNVTNSGSKLKFENHRFDKILDEASESSKMSYIKIHPKPSDYNHFRHYNTDSAWIYPIQLYLRQELAMQELESLLQTAETMGEPLPASYAKQQREFIKKNIRGYLIDRHAKFGEVPNLRLYMDLFKHEYA